MRIRTLVLSSILALAATAAHADFDGPCNVYAANARRDTTFTSGTYRVRFEDGTRDMSARRLSDNSYRLERKEGSGIAMLYPNGNGTFVLRLRDQRSGKCKYFIARVTSGTLTAYTAYYAAIGVAREYGFNGDDNEPVTRLYGAGPAQMRQFLTDVSKRLGEMRYAFTASKIK